MNLKSPVYLVFVILVVLTGCTNNDMPKEFEKRIIGDWCVVPGDHKSSFILFKRPPGADKCSVLRFDYSSRLYWYYIDTADTLKGALCGNALSHNEASNWYWDNDRNVLILDKIQTSIDEKKQDKRSYYVYEFKPDTFVCVLENILISKYETD